ncbi:uncharacterized protein I303_108372 [Kwoniella dejecticola CBS 10117]|uniref:Uncharacterized protein n=1 Tax=Kwoniella dejecticola CBS 10117 TaxID=1296121 RepID=A0A1A5ZXK7_9TREE|nr:uncharacterized protein I303_07301 [Kwoniella dejecticola CBS 10117]OBR82541.1 hypothetical protein I303_07301 [Kwoniella dejecticola CBS 10117]
MATMRTYRTSPKSVHAIVIVLFILLAAYIFFNGRKNTKGSSRTESDLRERDGEYPRRGRERDGNGDGASDPEDAAKNRERRRRDRRRDEKGDSEPDSGDRGSKTNKEKQKKSDRSPSPDREYKKRLKDPKIPWDQPSSAPPLSAPPHHRTATPSKSAFRRRDPDDRLPPSPNTQQGNRVKWTDEEKGLKSPVTRHARKWADYMGTTDDTEEGIFQNKPPKSEEKAPKGVIHPNRWQANNLTGKIGDVPDEILEMMKQIETISKAKQSDNEKLWRVALQDAWDEHLGSIPKIVTTISKELARYISKKDLDIIVKKMKQRQSTKRPPDSKRDVRKWTSAIDKLGVHPAKIGEEAYRYKFLLGWYLDTFRSKHYAKRMAIDDTTIPMTGDPKSSKASCVLGWLEYIAELNKAQRLFVGWDLSGLTIRAQAMKDKETNNLRLDLTIFLPCELEDPIHWTDRFTESCEAFRHFHVELIKALDGTPNDVIQGESFSRRRIIFRPGWTIKGVNAKNISDGPDQSIAQRTLLKRDPMVLEIFSEDQVSNSSRLKKLLGKLDHKETKKAISRVRPEELAFQRLRQYQWDKSTLTSSNNSLSPEAFWVAYMLLGDRLQNKVEAGDHHLPRSTYDFVRSIDLGSYIPFHETRPRTFLKIDKYPALELLVLAYVPLGQVGSTAELIFHEPYGLTHELSTTREPTQHLTKAATQLKLFVAIPNMQLLERFQNDLNQVFADKGRKLLAQGMPKSRIRSEIMGTAFKVLSNVYVVDESSATTAVDGKLPKGMRLDYQPSFPAELHSDDIIPQGQGRPEQANPSGSTTPSLSPFSVGEDRPSPFLPTSPSRPPGPPPQSTHGPFAPPQGPPTRSPRPNRPPAQFTDPQRADQALRDAQARGSRDAQSSPTSTTPQSNYQPPSVQEIDEEDEPMPTGRFGNLRNPDQHMSKGGSGEKGPQTYIP